MKRTIFALLVAGMMGFTLQAVADDTAPTSDQTAQKPDQKQFMKDCMAKAKAANNGMSQEDMKKACKEQLKANMGNPSQPVTPAH
jgi:hypothetical protein